MIDFATARRNMVDCQIRTKDVTDPLVTSAFLTVPRERFVPSSLADRAYIDEDVRVREADENGPARYVMEPVPLAALMALARIEPDAIVLDVGCATGYSTALLSQMAGSVVALESDAELAAAASENLLALDCSNAVVVEGPLAKGWPSEAPYDVIFLNGAVDEVPKALTDQLRDGGRLVAVHGQGLAGQGHLALRRGDTVSSRFAFNAAVEPLPGFQREAAFVF